MAADKMQTGHLIAAATLVAVAIGGASGASAGLLYDNGPINGTVDAWTISVGDAVENSFTLTTAATVTGVTFGGWTAASDFITNVDWGISTAAGSFADNGSAAVTTGSYWGNSYGYDIFNYSFSIPAQILAAGTYYLTLQNAVTANSDWAYWDENDGPSTALANGGVIDGSEAFAVMGTRDAPEPSTWAMMALGFGALAFAGCRRASKSVAAVAA